LTPKQRELTLGDTKGVGQKAHQLEIGSVIDGRSGDIDSDSDAVIVEDGRLTSAGAYAHTEVAVVR